jgi:hypothetical protein
VTYGSPLTLTATVTSGDTNTVNFYYGSTILIGSATPNNTGIATLTTSTLPAGGHSITATIAAGGNYGTNTSSVLPQTVNPATPTVIVSSSGSPSGYGSPVTFTATVPSGDTNTITFYNNGTSFESATASNGNAAVTISTLPLGSNIITARSWAGGNYSTNTSSSITQLVSAGTPVITWPAPVAIVHGTKLSATQLDATANVAGTFAYSPAAGTAPTLGSNTLSVTFTPTNTTDYTTATASVPLTVVQSATTMSLSALPTGQITWGTAVTITAAIAPSSATGTVTFMTGSTSLGAVSLAGGSAATTTKALPVGSNTITATYSGDAKDPGASATLQTPISVNTVTVSIIPEDQPEIPYGGPEPASIGYYVEDANGDDVSDNCYSGDPDIVVESDAHGNPFSLEPNVSQLPDTFPVAVTGLGTFTVNTTVAGCSQYSGSNVNTSQQGTWTIIQDSPAIVIDVTQVPYGQNYGSTVTLTNTNGVAVTGTVTFSLFDSNNSPVEVSGKITISKGQAGWSPCLTTCDVLSPGNYVLEVEYSGDFANAGASPPSVSLSIVQSNTFTLITEPIYINPDVSYTFTVTVVPDTNQNAMLEPSLPPDLPTGNIGWTETFPNGTVSDLSSGQLSSSNPLIDWPTCSTSTSGEDCPTFTFSLSFPLLAPIPPYYLNAEYSGDTNYNSSTASPFGVSPNN